MCATILSLKAENSFQGLVNSIRGESIIRCAFESSSPDTTM